MKILLLYSTILLTTTSVFAQLTVKPTTNGTDSFIYVKDQVLYVKEAVNLTRNISVASPTTDSKEASIYLRENGQLIQGNDNANTGSGQLSVQQNTPITNAWAYYLWCSPIGNSGVLGTPTANGNQNFGVNHIYEPLPISNTAARKSVPIPDQNGTENPLSISTRWLYTFESPGTEREGNYRAINGNTTAPPGFGFTMKGVGSTVPGDSQNYEFRGRPNNGTFSIPVQAPRPNLPNPPEGLMTLTGNPYPSALDLNKLYHDAENSALGTFWYYDEDRRVASHYYSTKPFGYGVYTVGPKDTDGNPYNGNNLGEYAAAPFKFYTAGGGTTGNSGTSTNSDDNKRFAPIGQGIMFVGDADGVVKIKNSHRIFFKEGNPGSVFQRPVQENENKALETIEYTSLSTHAETDRNAFRAPQMRIWSTFKEGVTREMVLAFYDIATDGYDRGLDGLSAQDLTTDAYFPIGDDTNRLPYVINGIKFNVDKQVPIAFKLQSQTKFDVKVVQEIKKPYINAYIFDSVENTYSQITRGQNATFNLPAGTYDNRFFIVFKNPNVRREIPEDEWNAISLVTENVKLFQNNSTHQLEVSNPEGYVIKTASVYDMSGKLVIGEKNLGSDSKYSFYTGNLSSGVYLVKLITDNDVAIDYKAIVHN